VPERSVVVTGAGVVTSCGVDLASTWAAVCDGRSGVAPIDRFPLYDLEARVGGVVPGYGAGAPEARSLALRDAGLPGLAAAGAAAFGVDRVVVSNHGERRLPARPGDRGEVAHAADIVAGIAREVGAPRHDVVYGACAGGSLAIGIASSLIRRGHADVVLAGGTDCLLRDFDFYSFAGLYAMSTRDCPPDEASCPFDRRRDGFVLSEGAGMLVLESAEHARRRDAPRRAVIEGFGYRQNAHHLVASPPDALGPVTSMQDALRLARAAPESVGYINAHGTSTRDNDWCETLAIRKVLGDRAAATPVSSVKGVMGHPMAAAGAVEAALCTEVLRRQVVPPTRNLAERDPHCDLDYVPGAAREVPVRRVMSNSFGFGGHSSCLVLGAA
jgi:3-oxoacyl-[acyl-carrier-protein] synthase II